MSKRILFGLMAILLSLGLVGAAFAYFSDTETSTGNTFTAGTLELTLEGSEGSPPGWITLTNWAPGDTESGNVVLTNAGSIGATQLLMDVAVTAGSPDISADVIVTEMTYPDGGVSILAAVRTALSDADTDLRLSELDALTAYDLGALSATSSGTLAITFDYDSAATAQATTATMVLTFDLNQ